MKTIRHRIRQIALMMALVWGSLPGSLNAAFCEGDPVNQVDPLGLNANSQIPTTITFDPLTSKMTTGKDVAVFNDYATGPAHVYNYNSLDLASDANAALYGLVVPRPDLTFAMGQAQADIVFDPNATGLEKGFGTAGFVSAGYLTFVACLPIVGAVENSVLKALVKTEAKVAVNLAVKSRFVHLGGSEIRKINIRPANDSKWGLTSKHLDKHFWGDKSMALKQIDPGGTTDKWTQHLTDLYNAPVSGTTPNGMLDIIKQFPKADGSGTFNMGIRLAPRANGTYDLITVLTRQ